MLLKYRIFLLCRTKGFTGSVKKTFSEIDRTIVSKNVNGEAVFGDETQVTNDMAALADTLSSPAEVFKYILNNFKTEFYYGSRPKNGAYNIDLKNPNPEIGVYPGDATVLEGIADESQCIIYFENPYGYYPINENSIRVLNAEGHFEIIGSPANRYVNKTPKMCNEYGLHYIEAEPIENIGQYTDSSGNVISPDKTPFFLHYIVTKQ